MPAQSGVEYRDLIVARKHQRTSAGRVGAVFSDAQIESWAKQLASGLAHLSEQKLVHQDLHNGNVMIAGVAKREDGTFEIEDDMLTSTRVKIIDLGLASFKSHRHRKMSGKSNARRFSFVEAMAEDLGGFKAIRAPEMWLSTVGAGVGLAPEGVVHYDAKVDVWSLGILLAEATLLSPIEEQVPVTG